MKLLVLAFLLCTLAVSTSVPDLFEFNDIKVIKDEETPMYREFQMRKEIVNLELSKIAKYDQELEVEVKKFLDIMLKYLISIKRLSDVYKITKLKIAYEFIWKFLVVKLIPSHLSGTFFNNLGRMFYTYEVLSRQEENPPPDTTPVDFVEKIVLNNQDKLTSEEYKAIFEETIRTYYFIYQYLITKYLRTFDKDHFMKFIFPNNFPESSKELLRLSDGDFDYTLKRSLTSLISYVKTPPLNRRKSLELLRTAVDKLYECALPEIKTFEWLPDPLFSSKPAPKPKPEPNHIPEPTPKSTPELVPEPTTKSKHEPTPEVKPEPTTKPKPEPTPELKPEPTTKSKPEPTPELKPDPTPKPTPGVKPEPAPEFKPELTPKPTPELKPEPTAELKPDPTLEPKPEPISKSKPEPTSKTDPDGSTGNQGLFGGKEKIFAICAIVAIIALFCGGFAFWRMQLRGKNLIAQSA